MQLWQLGDEHGQEGSRVENKVCWIILCVETCQEVPVAEKGANLADDTLVWKTNKQSYVEESALVIRTNLLVNCLSIPIFSISPGALEYLQHNYGPLLPTILTAVKSNSQVVSSSSTSSHHSSWSLTSAATSLIYDMGFKHLHQNHCSSATLASRVRKHLTFSSAKISYAEHICDRYNFKRLLIWRMFPELFLS